MDLLPLLQSFGLSDLESKVYLQALEKEFMTAGEIATLAGIKRSSTYHTLQSLIHKGLIATAGTKVEKFKAQPKEQLGLLLESSELRNSQTSIFQTYPKQASFP